MIHWLMRTHCLFSICLLLHHNFNEGKIQRLCLLRLIQSSHRSQLASELDIAPQAVDEYVIVVCLCYGSSNHKADRVSDRNSYKRRQGNLPHILRRISLRNLLLLLLLATDPTVSQFLFSNLLPSSHLFSLHWSKMIDSHPQTINRKPYSAGSSNKDENRKRVAERC